MRVHRLIWRESGLVRLSRRSPLRFSPLILTRAFHISPHRNQADFDPRSIERQVDEVDVCIVGGGPSGLSAAIRLKQLAKEQNRDIRVLLLEKGSEMGTQPTLPTHTHLWKMLFGGY